MIRFVLFVLIFCYACLPLSGQVTPPGLGENKSAAWFAFALRQSLDSANHKQSVSYIGVGRLSKDDYDPYKKQAIFVVNQEFYNQFHKHWQYSVALSYRWQNQYENVKPYDELDPVAKQEFRLYGRYSYIHKTERLRLVATFRQEIRKFYTPDYSDWKETLELRSRLRAQLSLNLNKIKTHRLVIGAEALFATGREGEEKKSWSKFTYTESRFAVYYSITHRVLPLVFNLGYMNNLLGTSHLTDVQYIALDVIWENPFRPLSKMRRKSQ